MIETEGFHARYCRERFSQANPRRLRPSAEIGQPQDIAPAAVFLASE